MGSVIRQGPVAASVFTRDLKTQPEPRTESFARASGQGNTPLLARDGVRAGQKLTLEYDGYFPPLPDSEGYGSATVTAHWQAANGRQGDSVPVQDSGWWGYGTQLSFDVPSDVDGPISVQFTETRKNGTVVPDPTTYTADVLPADAPIIKLDGSWQNTANGDLKRGGAFKIAYEVDRLRSQLNLQPGQKARLEALISFDGKYPEAKSLLYTDALGEHVDMPEVRIPSDAQNLRMWFVASVDGGKPGELRWDSDYGRDFTATIS